MSRTNSSAQIAAAMEAAVQTDPVWRDLPEWRPPAPFFGIRSGFFEGMSVESRPTRVFTYIGFPRPSSGQAQAPGVVLVHGGGGHAFLPWARQWMEAGYAVAAIDLTGCFPVCAGAGKEEADRESWTRALPPAPYTLPPIMEAVGDSSAPLERQWIYHAVGNTLLAGNLLRACTGVDKTRVGVMGISWGGVATSLAIGYDKRLAFAIPVYGSGFLEKNLTRLDTRFQGRDTLRLWSAGKRFDRARMPVLWQCWNQDPCFSLNTNSLSWQATHLCNPQTLLSIVHQMEHSHFHAWQREEPILFADWIVRGGSGPVRFQEEFALSAGDDFHISIRHESTDIMTSRLFTLSVPYHYAEDGPHLPWETVSCPVKGGCVSGRVPSAAKACYLELKSENEKGSFVVTSPLFEFS